MTGCMQLAGATRKGRTGWRAASLLGSLCPYGNLRHAPSGGHPLQAAQAVVGISHTVTGMQIQMSFFTNNCAVTVLKAELLPFKNHLGQSFAIKIVVKCTSPDISACLFSVCTWVCA